VQPAGYFDSEEHAGSAGGVVSANDRITAIGLSSGVNAVDYDFCELVPASISGHIHVDLDGDCEHDPGEPDLAGVTVQLLDAQGNVVATTLTDVHGMYSFGNLKPGTYGIREIQPAGYYDSQEHAGSAGGVVSANDLITAITLGSGVNAVDYDFCELLPGSISGHVHADLDGDCEVDPDEPDLAGVTIQLLNAEGGIVATTTTDVHGMYKFSNLAPGSYGVREIQPAGYFDSEEHAGTSGGIVSGNDLITQIVLDAGVVATEYDFCEIPPASLSGHVQVDFDGDCVLDPGEFMLPGVVIHLLDQAGSTIATTQTDINGEFHFTGLAPGVYGLSEEQPIAYLDGDEDVGSAGGLVIDNDLMIDIDLGSGVNAIDYHFCEVPGGSIAGFVFRDGPAILVAEGELPDIVSVRNGLLTSDDKRLAGVTLELRHGITGVPILGSEALPGHYAADQPIRTVTDKNGHYVFTGLRAGIYGVFEVQPDAFVDSIDTPGTSGGIAFNPHQTVDPLVIEQLSVSPKNDAIIRIALFAGESSINNNFSEVTTTTPPPPPPPPPPPEPPPKFFFTIDPPPPPQIIPAAAPGVVPGFQPLAPPVAQQIAPRPVYSGASPVMDYTWHLSVIDAGLPRPCNMSDTTRLTSVKVDNLAWQKTNLGESLWTLSGKNARGTRPILFGMRGGIPVTGDFNGDGITDVGVFDRGEWFIDLNGNGLWDEGDLWARLGHDGDKPVTGDWDGDGKTDIGVYGPAWPGDPRAIAEEPGLPDPDNRNRDKEKNIPPAPHFAAQGSRSLRLTSTGAIRADLIDHVFHYGTPNDIPVVGDWNGDGIDTIAIFHAGSWQRDYDGDGKRSAGDMPAQFGQAGDKPVVGDFNGDGVDEIGVYRDGKWIIDSNGNGVFDAEDETVALGGNGDAPVVGDWDGDGRDEPGVYHDGQITHTENK